MDKALQRLVNAGQLRRIDRGLYDQPKVNSLTKKAATPDYHAIVDTAIARRDQLHLLVDGMTAANDLGLTGAVPAHINITHGALKQYPLLPKKHALKQTSIESILRYANAAQNENDRRSLKELSQKHHHELFIFDTFIQAQSLIK